LKAGLKEEYGFCLLFLENCCSCGVGFAFARVSVALEQFHRRCCSRSSSKPIPSPGWEHAVRGDTRQCRGPFVQQSHHPKSKVWGQGHGDTSDRVRQMSALSGAGLRQDRSGHRFHSSQEWDWGHPVLLPAG